MQEPTQLRHQVGWCLPLRLEARDERAIWGCLLLAGDRLYVGNVEGIMTVLRAGRRKELLAQTEMDAPLYSRPAAIGDALYLATARRLYLLAAKP
jgi:hypothetical protein